MKQSVLIVLAAMIPSLALSQSTFQFINRHLPSGIDAPVFDAFGNRLSGTNYVAILYGGPTVDWLTVAWEDVPHQPMPPVPFTFMPGGQSGYFNYDGFQSDFVEIRTVSCGGIAWLQVRAWDVRLGATYEEVVNLGLGGYGESNLFQKQGGMNCGPFVSSPSPLIGLESFALREVIPEPSATLLLLLSLPALLFLRRRRSP